MHENLRDDSSAKIILVQLTREKAHRPSPGDPPQTHKAKSMIILRDFLVWPCCRADLRRPGKIQSVGRDPESRWKCCLAHISNTPDDRGYHIVHMYAVAHNGQLTNSGNTNESSESTK